MHLIKEIFKSQNFVIGFVIFMIIFLSAIILPFFLSGNPLEIVGGLFYKPGTYISVSDAIDAKKYELKLDTLSNKISGLITQKDQDLIREWLIKYCDAVSEEEVKDAKHPMELVELWMKYYDPSIKMEGTTIAYRKNLSRLHQKIEKVFKEEGYTIAEKDSETGELTVVKEVTNKDYVHTSEIPNKRTFILGTDNFGRDVFTELISAIWNSIKIGFVAGSIATLIGLVVGLLSGYVGGVVDDILTFITNLLTVIPSFVILILISVSLGGKGNDIMTTALVIGITAWPWTARSVRAQTLSLKNRDHVNLSKLSGHSLPRIIVRDILPYVASYVTMAYILQVASAILAEAQLSMLGLGPRTTEIATLGLMLRWAIQFQAPLSGAWWAFIPVILSIALITFSLNLMNTGLDQVFNPQLRQN